MKTWVNGEILNADKMNTLEQSVPASATSSNGVVTFKNGAGTDLFSVEISAPTQNDDSIYILRTLPYTSYLKQLQKIIGGTVAWNQIVPTANRDFTSTTTDTRALFFVLRKSSSPYTLLYQKQNVAVGILSSVVASSFDGYAEMTHSGSQRNIRITPANGFQLTNGHKYLFSLNFTGVDTSTVGGVVAKDISVYDLTLLFGSTIADYVYTLESGTAGAGIAWLKKYGYFTKPYYPYAAANLLSVKPSASKAISPDGNSYALYPFDSTIELRGLLKLDASNNLHYDGDEYASDGTVTRRYGIVDLGTLEWYNQGNYFYNTTAINPVSGTINWVCTAFTQKPSNVGWTAMEIGMAGFGGTQFRAKHSATSTAGFKTAMSGVYLVYELATPTTESSTPYIEHQACFPNGTEQFVDGRTVEMPVEAVAEYEVTS